MKKAEDIEDAAVWDIDREKALAAPERITMIAKYILEHFDQKTIRNSFYNLNERRLAGFNSIFATASIDVCKLYYSEFKKQQKDLPEGKRLKIAAIFPCGVTQKIPGDLPDENSSDPGGLSDNDRAFLQKAIEDYNALFKCNFSAGEGSGVNSFENYYRDVSQRVKNREIDLLIVVNMFLTGFDATTLNTLWVDKNLRLHGLL
jgi:type I restriction enzyme R subunit